MLPRRHLRKSFMKRLGPAPAQSHRHAVSRRLDGERPANARPCTGDQRALTIKLHDF
jgi:hypothetical protein